MVPTNATKTWTDPLEYGTSDLLFKIADYIPRVEGVYDIQRISVDTYYRPIYIPSYFFDYFNATYVIQAYTCDVDYSFTYP